MWPRTATSFGMPTALDGLLGRRTTSQRAAIGTEVRCWKKSWLTKPLTSLFLFPGGLDTDEPWQGTWSGGVFVECVGQPEEEAVSATTVGPARPKEESRQEDTKSDNSRGQIVSPHLWLFAFARHGKALTFDLE